LKRLGVVVAGAVTLSGCAAPASPPPSPSTVQAVPASDVDYSGCDDVLSGGVTMIARVGNNPATKVLLLHGDARR
jgi:PBP1b-binding outer membrane lipoprotein LpoB